MATMAQNHKVGEVIVGSIKINVMDFKPALSAYTCFAFIWKGVKSFFPVFGNYLSFVSAFMRAKNEFSTFPVGVRERFFTCRADGLNNLSRFTFEVAIRGAKCVFDIVCSNKKVSVTKFTSAISCGVSETIGTRDAAESSFRAVCGECLTTS